MTDWFLIKSRTLFEPNVCRHIEQPYNGGEATCLPCGNGRAFLPGYLFARCFPLPCLDECFSAKPRLFQVFSSDSPETGPIFVPFMVSSEMVAELIQLALNQAETPPVPLWQQLIGQKIRIRSGPLMGYMAKIKSISQSDGIVKLRLFNKIMGKAVYLSMNLEDL